MTNVIPTWPYAFLAADETIYFAWYTGLVVLDVLFYIAMYFISLIKYGFRSCFGCIKKDVRYQRKIRTIMVETDLENNRDRVPDYGVEQEGKEEFVREREREREEVKEDTQVAEHINETEKQRRNNDH